MSQHTVIVFAPQTQHFVDDFGNMMLVVNNCCCSSNISNSDRPQTKKDICIQIINEWIAQNKPLKRSEIIKLFMTDDRLKMEKTTASTYYYNCLDSMGIKSQHD